MQDLIGELTAVFTSGRKRSHDSAKALAPNAELIADPLFAEAPLASPRIPILQMKVPKWAVVARILWHAGYHPEIENYRKAKHRAAQAADILMHRARAEGTAALVAHGYFNFLIGRELRHRGFQEIRLAQGAVLECGDLRSGVKFGTRRARSLPVLIKPIITIEWLPSGPRSGPRADPSRADAP